MVPPTGVSDSILVIKRNGASLESCNGALAPRIKTHSMESNDGRTKKNWGEKRKISKSGKSSIEDEMIETSNFMVHPDYLSKYGTLSNGVLTKSIKYAETWFYGTVGVRGGPSQRPSLFLYPGVVSPQARIVNQHSYLTPSSAFLGLPALGYASSERGTYRRRPSDPRFGDRTSRPCTDCGKDVRSGNFCKKCAEKRTGSCKNISNKSSPSSDESSKTRSKKTVTVSDPYNFMRKSRLGEGRVVRSSILYPTLSQKKFRTTSASPSRKQNKEPISFTFETFKSKEQEKETKAWESDWVKEEEVVRRKSILECDLNAYDLNQTRKETKEDEDFIEDFGDPFLSNSEVKILRPKLDKTDFRRNEERKRESKREIPKNSEVRLNGQRFKIFDHSNASTTVIEGYVSDEDDFPKEAKPAVLSPQRPPRKAKNKASLESSFRYSKSKSKSSPNLSIKSILKKPPPGDEASLKDFDILYEEPTEISIPESPLQNQSRFSKKQNHSTLKKKKQVQFRVNGSSESLNQTQNSTTEEKMVPEIPGTLEDLSKGLVPRSKSCENLPLASAPTPKEPENEGDPQEKDSLATKDRYSNDEMSKKNHNFRRSSFSVLFPKDDSFFLLSASPKENLFNDTMALRKPLFRSMVTSTFIVEKKKPELISENHKFDPISDSEMNKLENVSNSVEIQSKESSFKRSKSGRKSCPSIEIKLNAPNPPPRQLSSTKPKKIRNSGATSVLVNSEGSTEKKGKKSNLTDGEENVKVSSARSLEIHSASNLTNKVKECKTVVELGSLTEKEISKGGNEEEIGTSIVIHAKSSTDESSLESRRKTSVIINNFDPKDDNKVRINVRSEPSEGDSSPSTCTIIETGSNATVIPVVSTDNKTTLIVGSSPSMVSSAADECSFPYPQTQSELCQRNTPVQYIFSTSHTNSDKSVEFMDPVEAVRRNLIPHICGKEDSGPTLMEKIKQSREIKEPKQLTQFSRLFKNPIGAQEISAAYQPTQCLLPSNKFKSWKAVGLNSKFEEDSSTNTSRSNSFCSTVTSSLKNSSGETSRSSSFRSYCCQSLDDDIDTRSVSSLAEVKCKFYIHSDPDESSGQEKDKLECEYEIANGFKDEPNHNSENIYETIREEPFYDKIGPKKETEKTEDDDVPPPLPLTLPPSLEEKDKRFTKSIFEGASKYDILNYLVDAKERVKEEVYFSENSAGEDVDCRLLSEKRHKISEINEITSSAPLSETLLKKDEGRSKREVKEIDSGSKISHSSQISSSSDDNVALSSVSERNVLKLSRKSSAEIERNDSGVGSETSHTSRSKWQSSSSASEDPRHPCEDCDQAVEAQVTDSGVIYAPLVCRKCSKRRSERKEIIQEIVETEEKYGRDLKIILEEFYTPMLVAGLLTPDQLSSIFLNTEELLENSEQLTEKLRDALEIAFDQGDEDLLTVNVGKHFLEAGPMLHSFESYCTRQGSAALLLANLEKEKELLRIFLRVSQMENAVLRRMNLNSFLMVPVQRVTKYPLLLARLYKVTPLQQEGRELLKEAQHNIELHLEHMNSEAKDVSTAKVWRRFSTSTVSGRKSTAELEMINIKLRKMAVDVLDWNHEEVRFVMEGKLLYSQPADSNWKKGRTIKLTPVFVLLATLGKPNAKYKVDPPEDELTFPAKTGIREATLLLVKEKCGRYTLIREPLFLDKIIVCCETDVDEYFEVQELSTKDSFIFKAEDGERTKEWYRYLQYHAQILGSWRRRRNALANIMINGMTARTYTS